MYSKENWELWIARPLFEELYNNIAECSEIFLHEGCDEALGQFHSVQWVLSGPFNSKGKLMSRMFLFTQCLHHFDYLFPFVLGSYYKTMTELESLTSCDLNLKCYTTYNIYTTPAWRCSILRDNLTVSKAYHESWSSANANTGCNFKYRLEIWLPTDMSHRRLMALWLCLFKEKHWKADKMALFKPVWECPFIQRFFIF